MKNKIKLMVVAVVTVIIIGVIVLLLFLNSKKDENLYLEEGDYIYNRDLAKIYDESGGIDPLNYLEKDEKFVTNKKADSLQDVKQFLEYTFSNFKAVIGEKDNRIVLMVENQSDVKIDGKEVAIHLLNKSEEEIGTIYIFIPEMEAHNVLYINGITDIKMEDIFNYTVDTSLE